MIMFIRAQKAAVRVAAGLLLLLIYLSPAILNRSPVLYPDSLGYYQSGEATLKAFGIGHVAHIPGAEALPGTAAKTVDGANVSDGVSTARSVYYGALFALSYDMLGRWAIAVLQIGVCVLAMWLALRVTSPVDVRKRWMVIAATGVISGVAVFACTALPDVFAGLLILASAVLIVHGAGLSWAERGWWAALLLGAELFHKSHVAVAIPMLTLATAWLAASKRGSWRGLLLAWAATGLAVAGHLAIDYEVRARLKVDPISPPFILARMIGDRTAEAFLRENCQRRAFETCRFVLHMPMTENEFLWSTDRQRGGFALLDLAGKRRVLAEQPAILEGTLSTRGGAQLLAGLNASARQILLPGVREYGLAPTNQPGTPADILPLISDYRLSTIARGEMPLGAISILISASYFASTIVLILLIAASRSKSVDLPRSSWVPFATFTLAGVILNGIVCGSISGVFDRYQGRVAWLTTFVALAWLWARWAETRVVRDH